MKQNNKKESPYSVLAIIAIFLLLPFMLNDYEGSLIFLFLSVLLIVEIIILVNKSLSPSLKRGEKPAEESAPAQPAAPSKPAVRMNAAFPQPEAHCVVCENTGDDHFAHDREQRIKQLDEWLKNGLIDRKEYQVMKARYERDQ